MSIRQPYAEEILRRIKRIEYRTRPTKIIGERFYIYVAGKIPPEDQLAEFSQLFPTVAELKAAGLPKGVLVGTAVIVKVTGPTKKIPYYHWHIGKVKRLKKPRKPKRQPQPTWFNPF